MFEKKTYSIITTIAAFGLLIGIFTYIFSNRYTPEPIFIHEKVLLTPPDSVHNVRPVDKNDHVWGDPNAPVVIIEYSDLECPFCKIHHGNMIRLINEYRGKVAWVYRHHPLDHRFTKSRKEAEASECVAALGGNAAFWKFIGQIYTITPSNDGLDFSLLPELAENVGVKKSDFNECFDNRVYAGHVEADFQNARKSGLTFTPSSIIVWPNKKKKSLVIGARNYEILTTTLNIILGEGGISEQLPRDRNDAFSR